ncbi:hypothetical protein ACIO87_35810 [Streptomyces sp. NPDC087218]|uniref:hypothetical protein n=1 Tax=Streptomyces sp. NPDC087218 TaxID=3365769 RepID=UPI0038043DE4
MGILGKLLGNDGPATIPAPAERAVATWPRRGLARNDEVARAAGVGLAHVRCHRTTWDYLQEQVHQQHANRIRQGPQAFRQPADDEITTGPNGIVTVPLGGSSLAAVLDWCHEMQSCLREDVDRGIGRRVGLAISRALENLSPSDGQAGPVAVIWLDDRIATAQDPAPAP